MLIRMTRDVAGALVRWREERAQTKGKVFREGAIVQVKDFADTDNAFEVDDGRGISVPFLPPGSWDAIDIGQC